MSFVAILRKIFAILPGASRKQVGFLLLAMLVNACSEVSGVAGLLPFVAMASDPTMIETKPWLTSLYQWSGCATPHTFLVYLGLAFMTLLVATNLFNAFTYWFSLRVCYDLSYRLSVALLGRYLARPYLWFLTNNTSNLTNMVLPEMDALAEKVVLSCAEMLTMSLVAVFVSSALLWIDPVVALSTATMLGLLYRQIYNLTRRQLQEVGEQRHHLNAQRYRTVREALNSIKEARAVARGPLFLQAYRSDARKYRRYAIMERLVSELPRYATEVLALLAIGTVLIYLVSRGQSSQQVIPLVGVYIMATWRLVPALQTIYRNAALVRFHTPLLDLIHGELCSPEETTVGSVEGRLPLQRELRLKGVSFTYPGNREPALDGISLEITKGEVVGLVGRTGSGKTTLADILAGLLPPDRGTMQIDGITVEPGNRLRWVSNVGYVPQDVFLTDDTVARNVALGYPQEQIDGAAVARAAQTARLSEVVEQELQQGYDTPLGERGVSLSGGQRQRVGIARALYEDPEFLILDEATSALDNLTEREVMEAIQVLAGPPVGAAGASGQKTLVLIAHRLTTVQLCDRIYFLERGRLLAQGTYQELLENSPEFVRLAQTELDRAAGNVNPNP